MIKSGGTGSGGPQEPVVLAQEPEEIDDTEVADDLAHVLEPTSSSQPVVEEAASISKLVKEAEEEDLDAHLQRVGFSAWYGVYGLLARKIRENLVLFLRKSRITLFCEIFK